MKIPGCQQGQCTDVAKDKKFLGGADLRAENAPKRLDDDVPVDPRKKLDKLREGLVSIGVGPDDFDRAWGRLCAKLGDLNLVVQQMNQLFTEVLQNADRSGRAGLQGCRAAELPSVVATWTCLKTYYFGEE